MKLPPQLRCSSLFPKRDSFLDYHLLWQKFSSLTALRALEPAIALFSFDNIVFPQPARHNLQLCYARPIAADVNFVEPAFVRCKSSSEFGFCSLTRSFVEPSVADLGFQLSDFTFHLSPHFVRLNLGCTRCKTLKQALRFARWHKFSHLTFHLL